MVSLKLKNLTLLGSWWNRYNANRTTLWKVVIYSRHKRTIPFKLMEDPSQVKGSTLSFVWKSIVQLQRHYPVDDVLGYHNWVWRCGKGDNISFWDDRWVGNQSFKSLFPALFALVVDNKAKVSESYVILDDDEVYWNVFFSRSLSAEERIQASVMLLKLRSIYIRVHEEDEV